MYKIILVHMSHLSQLIQRDAFLEIRINISLYRCTLFACSSNRFGYRFDFAVPNDQCDQNLKKILTDLLASIILFLYFLQNPNSS